jgi:hypothetical protein
MNKIPTEIYIIIFEYLEFKDKLNFSIINKKAYISFKNVIKKIKSKSLYEDKELLKYIILNTKLKSLIHENEELLKYIEKYISDIGMSLIIDLPITFKDGSIKYEVNYNFDYKGMEPIECRIRDYGTEIIVHKNKIYLNEGRCLSFAYQITRLKCLDKEINSLHDAIKIIKKIKS